MKFFGFAGCVTLAYLVTYWAVGAVGIGSKSGNVLEGEVLFKGAVLPRATTIQNTTDPQSCGKIQSLENVVISAKGEVKNAIVSLKNAPLPSSERTGGF